MSKENIWTFIDYSNEVDYFVTLTLFSVRRYTSIHIKYQDSIFKQMNKAELILVSVKSSTECIFQK